MMLFIHYSCTHKSCTRGAAQVFLARVHFVRVHHADLLKLSKYHNYTCGTLSTLCDILYTYAIHTYICVHISEGWSPAGQRRRTGLGGARNRSGSTTKCGRLYGAVKVGRTRRYIEIIAAGRLFFRGGFNSGCFYVVCGCKRNGFTGAEHSSIRGLPIVPNVIYARTCCLLLGFVPSVGRFSHRYMHTSIYSTRLGNALLSIFFGIVGGGENSRNVLSCKMRKLCCACMTPYGSITRGIFLHPVTQYARQQRYKECCACARLSLDFWNPGSKSE